MTRALVVLLVVWCCASHRQRCPAPPGWYAERVRPSGSYELAPVLGRPQDDLDDARARREIAGPAPVDGWIICTGGARAIVVDYRTVGCQLGGWP